MKTANKRELQQFTIKSSSDIEFKDFMKIYKNVFKESIRFLVSDTTCQT